MCFCDLLLSQNNTLKDRKFRIYRKCEEREEALEKQLLLTSSNIEQTHPKHNRSKESSEH